MANLKLGRVFLSYSPIREDWRAGLELVQGAGMTFVITEDPHVGLKLELQAGGGGGAVSSVFGRTGAVVAQAGDYTAGMVGADPVGAALALHGLDEPDQWPSLPGRDGAQGATGPAGMQGQDGADGESDTWPQQPGRDGAPGLVGAAGPQGLDGADGEDPWPAQPGAQGLQGCAGRAGFDGQDGQDACEFPGPVTLPTPSPLATKGDLLVMSAAGPQRLAVGADTQVLRADSTQSTGVLWGYVFSAIVATQYVDASLQVDLSTTPAAAIVVAGGTIGGP